VILNQIDLIVRDVPGAAAFLRDALGLTLRVNEERYAELVAGPMTIMLSPDAMVPMKGAGGVILHFQVEDVAAACGRAQEHGAAVLLPPTRTDWGTESALIAGPEGVVIDLYRPATAPGTAA
jgi:predicted enzyme related to lactoylglutathione lyase